jgi:acyl carrier protein
MRPTYGVAAAEKGVKFWNRRRGFQGYRKRNTSPMADAITIESIQQQLCTEIEILVSLKPGSITPDTDLTKLGIDSLRFVSLLLVIEQKFGVNLMKTGLTSEDTKSVVRLAAAVQAGRKP